MNSGVITVRAGTANRHHPAGGSASVGQRRAHAGRHGQYRAVRRREQPDATASSKAAATTSATPRSNSSDPNIVTRQANAMVVANGNMNVYLRSAPLDDLADGVPFDGNYSLIIRGGTATARNPGTASAGRDRARRAAGGPADHGDRRNHPVPGRHGHPADRQRRRGEPARCCWCSDNKTITTSGSMVLIGGTANVNATDAVTLSPLTSTEAANAQAHGAARPEQPDAGGRRHPGPAGRQDDRAGGLVRFGAGSTPATRSRSTSTDRRPIRTPAPRACRRRSDRSRST